LSERKVKIVETPRQSMFDFGTVSTRTLLAVLDPSTPEKQAVDIWTGMFDENPTETAIMTWTVARVMLGEVDPTGVRYTAALAAMFGRDPNELG
jgi:hypothetical protein